MEGIMAYNKHTETYCPLMMIDNSDMVFGYGRKQCT